MNWVKTYEAFIWEGAPSNKDIEVLEKILKLPNNSGVFSNVFYDDKNKELVIEQPTDISAMDSGSVITSINREKTAIKKTYKNISRVVIGDLQITI